MLVIPLARYGMVNDGVSVKYRPERGDWEGRIRGWTVVFGVARAFSMALL